MIERVTVRDFQPHRLVSLELDQPVLCLVGPSDKGKSSLVRALRWLALNRPLGDEFIGRFGKAPFAGVRVHLDGHVIERVRGGAKNLYKLDGKVYKAFGSGVPTDIAQLLNLGEENFQGQLDAPFLLTLSPSEVAVRFNSIVNLGLIDRTLTNASRMVHRAKTTISITKERLLNASTRKKGLAWAVACRRDVANVQAVHDRLVAARQKADSLRQAVSEAAARGRDARRLSDAVQHGLITIKVGQELVEKTEQRDTLRTLTAAVRGYDKFLARPAPDLSELDRTYRAYEDARQRLRTLNSLLMGLDQANHEIQFADVQIAGLKDRLKKLAGDRCPTCNRPWN